MKKPCGVILAGLALLLSGCQLTQLLQPTRATERGLPNLTVGDYSWGVSYEGCAWGGTGTVVATVWNEGTAASGEVEVELNGVLVILPSIPPGGNAAATVHFDSGPLGGVSLKIDPNHRILESSEDDNEYQIFFTPPPPCE